MPASLAHPFRHADGRNLVAGGATFRVWAPKAKAVYVVGDFNHRVRNDAALLTRDQQGTGGAFSPA